MYSRVFFTLAIALICGVNASEEGLALRRIADFWEEGEYQIAKTQMEEFLVSYPESDYANVLSRALGDLFLREKSYKAALDHYSQVKDREEIFLNRLQCLYHLEWHATLADECEEYLKTQETGAHRLQATYFLAIALYSQALTADDAVALAERAKPYFELLAKSELSDEVAGAYAHLRCILKDFQGASEIYLDLAKRNDSSELLFQAALMQAKYDKNVALETFAQIQSGPLASEAFYNRLVLYFDQGRFEEIIAGKDQWLNEVPDDKEGLVHLFVGQSHLALKQYEQASHEINVFLDSNVAEEQAGPAVMRLVEAGYQSGDLKLLEQAIGRLPKESLHSATASFCRALLLKKDGRLEEARDQLKALPELFPERAQALFELAQIELGSQNWDGARSSAIEFLSKYPESELCVFARDIAAHATLKLGMAAELEGLVGSDADWKLQVARLYFEQGAFEKASTLCDATANGELLHALCLKQLGNEEGYVAKAESALSSGANLLPLGEQHLALYNWYLSHSVFEKAAGHLFGAFEEKVEIQKANLFWLAGSLEGEKAYKVLLHVREELVEPSLQLKLGKLHELFGHEAEALAMYEGLDTNEAKLALAEMVLRKGELERAEALFDEIARSDSFRDGIAASAALQSARLKRGANQLELAAVLLKDLTIQKNLVNEPLHLEAALDYADLQSGEKKLALLKKTKADFESQEDILSKDYHAARSQLPEKNNLYLGYMQLMDAEILLVESELNSEDSARKELQTKAKEILLQIKGGAQSPVVSRAEKLLGE